MITWVVLTGAQSKVRQPQRTRYAKTAGMIRISFGIYNTEEEVDEFLEFLPKAMAEARQRQENEDVNPEY